MNDGIAVVGTAVVGVIVGIAVGLNVGIGGHLLESYSGRKLLVENGWITP